MDRYQGVDLHTHSTASDGRLTPTELVELAESQGVSWLALTDHDTLAGLEEAQGAALGKLNLINGVELSVAWGKFPLHIVLLGDVLNHSGVQSWVQHNQLVRLQRAERINVMLQKQGLPDLLPLALEKASGAQLGRPHFAQAMVELRLVKDMNRAFDLYLSNKRLGALRDVWPDINEVLPTLAGVDVILAHPKRYPLTATKLRSLLADFKTAGGTAVEIVSGNERPEHVRYMERLAQDFAFQVSVGSDYHGPFGPWSQVGKYTQVKLDNLVPVWEKWQ
ncbi:PHP domain-containing protein [Maribrevibacterium harenarium]|uniref:PHP domain-containing protein n=1 Tax=Maribrevibacterium harenarium TaxID=2589817 RepID=A0A501X2Q7_9GAMM|nr:PHP domain-containing protein [Maribrevibacterium harenarium]TPE54744.1 PHP domain-containing protein [Maribrevibacterium harenarium]